MYKHRRLAADVRKTFLYNFGYISDFTLYLQMKINIDQGR